MTRAAAGSRKPTRSRLLAIGVVALMAVGSLALWTAIPAGWMWVTRDMEPA